MCYGLNTFSWRLVACFFMDIYPLNIIPAIWMISKILFFLYYSPIKAIVPRYRYDQLMRLGWKIFLPFSLIYLVLDFKFLILF